MPLNDKVTEALRQEISETLSQMSQHAQAVQSQMEAFLQAIDPEIKDAIAANDLLSLNLIRDRIAGKLGSVMIGVIHQERVALLAVITAVLRTIVRMGIGAI